MRVAGGRRPGGSVQFNPTPDVRPDAGDVLIAIGERQKLKQLEGALAAGRAS